MAKDFFQTIAAKAGFAGEYEPLIESEFAVAPSGPYTPGEEGVFKTVPTTSGRTIQLLQSSPIYIETFQASDATLRVPSGLISDNDASDGRFYFIRNNVSATGVISIERSDGTFLNYVYPGDLLIVLHGENDDWDISESISLKNNFTATVDPNINDDVTLGYGVGSTWINVSTNTVYTATSVVAGAAVWKTSSTGGASPVITPGEFMFGTLLDYPSPGNVTAGTVFYLRLKMSAGVILSGMRTFIDSGGTASRNLRMGLYSQTDPANANSVPNARVAQTNSVNTSSDNGLFKTVAFVGGNYTIADTGFYWLAIVSDSTSLKFAVTAASRANFLPIRQESGAGTTLPANAGVLTNPVSAVIYVSAVEA